MQIKFQGCSESNFPQKDLGKLNLTTFAYPYLFVPFGLTGLNRSWGQPFVNRLWVQSRLQEPVRRRTDQERQLRLFAIMCVKISPNIWTLEITTCQRRGGRETDRDECISPGPPKPPNQDTAPVHGCAGKAKRQTDRESKCVRLSSR